MALLISLLSPQAVFSEAVYIIPPGSSSSQRNELVYQNMLSDGATVTKPDCGVRLARIYTSIARALGNAGSPLYGLTGINAAAVDNGTYWTIYAEARTVNNGLVRAWPYMVAHVQVWCCTNDLCN